MSEPDARPAPDVRLTLWLHGRVQGVGMRWWIRSRAGEAGLAGWARNLDDGRVEVVAQGPEAACRGLLEQLRSGGPATLDNRRPGRIDTVVERWSPADTLAGGGDRRFEER